MKNKGMNAIVLQPFADLRDRGSSGMGGERRKELTNAPAPSGSLSSDTRGF